LGYGRRRERDADSRAIDALLALDYDAQSAIQYLNRLHDAGLRHDPAIAETAVAHPTPLDRIRRIERMLYGRVGGSEAPRVNREVFRRAIPAKEFGLQLVRVELDRAPAALDDDRRSHRDSARVERAVGRVGGPRCGGSGGCRDVFLSLKRSPRLRAQVGILAGCATPRWTPLS
jgi:predicted Zn-dependent protease